MMRKNKFTSAIGAKIRSEREKQKFSQEGFADFICFDRSNYGAIERGERNISIQTLIKIALGLKIEPGKLLPPLSEIAKLLPKQS